MEEHFFSKDSPGIMKRKGVRPILTPRHSEKALLSDSTSSSDKTQTGGKLSGIGTFDDVLFPLKRNFSKCYVSSL